MCSCPILFHPMDSSPLGTPFPFPIYWTVDSPGKNAGVGCHFLPAAAANPMVPSEGIQNGGKRDTGPRELASYLGITARSGEPRLALCWSAFVTGSYHCVRDNTEWAFCLEGGRAGVCVCVVFLQENLLDTLAPLFALWNTSSQLSEREAVSQAVSSERSLNET